MGLKFNPPPGWPVPYGFDPPPGWQPDPTWPAPPPNWPLWMGSDAPRPGAQANSVGSHIERYASQRGGAHAAAPAAPAPPQAHPAGYQAQPYGFGPPPASTGRGRGRRSLLQGLAAVVVSILAAIIAINLSHGSAGSGTSTSHSHGTAKVSILTLRPGACFQSPASHLLIHGRTVYVAAVRCTAAHNAQIFAQFRATGGAGFPGRKALVAQSAHDCRSVIAAKLSKSKVTPKMLIIYLFPEQTSWFVGRRTIDCVVYDSAKELTTSVMKAGAAG